MDYKQSSRIGLLAIALVAACGFVATSALADLAGAKPNVKELKGLDGISWETTAAYNGARLVVSGPDGFRMQRDFGPGDTLFLDFAGVADAAAPNGRYKYELTFSPALSAEDKALAADARAIGEDLSFLAQLPRMTGVFTLADGNPVDFDLPETTLKDIVHLDDVIIDGSLCVGFDCVNGESFGFDTIRLKENNIRIRFQDTSTSASFPRNNWILVANDTSNGGQERFSIEDATNGRVPFTVEGGAPSHSLYVDDGGRIGFGTSTPVVELHVKDGDTPTLRLEQDGSSGFTPQTWDVAGNEAGFFVRDATTGSRLVFRVRPAAPTSAIDVQSNGNVGLNNSSAQTPLHITRAGPVQVRLDNTTSGVAWNLNSAGPGTFRISDAGGVGTAFELKANGNLEMEGTCIAFDTNGTDFACTFSLGGVSCAAGNCP